MKRLPLLLFTLLVPLTAAAQVTVELRMPSAGTIGEPIPLRIAFTNRAEDAVYIHFTGADYGAGSLVICAEKDGQWYSTGQVHLDRDIADARLDYVPLRRDQSFESPVLSINDSAAASLPILRLPSPGTYDVFATYSSTGPASVGVLWPVWRGSVRTQRHRLTLEAPRASDLAARRQELIGCASHADGGGCEPDVIGYFRIVRDAQAAAVLVDLLNETAVPDPVLLEAVANQDVPGTAEALARFASRFPRYADAVRNLGGASSDLRMCQEGARGE